VDLLNLFFLELPLRLPFFLSLLRLLLDLPGVMVPRLEAEVKFLGAPEDILF
jgi:hypothetical protein